MNGPSEEGWTDSLWAKTCDAPEFTHHKNCPMAPESVYTFFTANCRCEALERADAMAVMDDKKFDEHQERLEA